MKIDFSNTTKQAILNMIQDREELYYSDISPVDLVNCKNAYDSDFVIYSTDINEGINGTNAMLSNCNDNSDKLAEETETVFSTAQQFDADYVQKIETDTETTTKDYFQDLQKLVDAVAVKSLGNTREEILYNLARYSGTNIFESSDSFSNYLSDIDGSVVFDKDEYITYDANGEIVYDWEKLNELLTKDPYLLTKEEFNLLVEVVKTMDIEDIENFVQSSWVSDDAPNFYIASNTAMAALEASEYSLYGDMISGNISNEEYISQLMLINMTKIAGSDPRNSLFLDEHKIRYIYDIDNNVNMEYPDTITREWYVYDTYGKHVGYDWMDSVRYLGHGTTPNLITDVEERYDYARENSLLSTFVLETASCFIPDVVSVGIGLAENINDRKKMGPNMDEMINTFDLHVIQIESADTGNIFSNGLKTKITESVYPSDATQEKLNEFNLKVDGLRQEYSDANIEIPIQGDLLKEALEYDKGNEYFTLKKDEEGNVYIEDIKNITVYDLMTCPNKVNELYYVVGIMQGL